MEYFNELRSIQAKVEIDLMQTFEAYRQAQLKSKSYAGGMTWKTQNGAQYLIRLHGRTGHGKSLGRKSELTEAIFLNFHSEKKRVAERLLSLKAALTDYASMAKTVKLGRVPLVVANVLRAAESEGLLGKNLMVIGTNAMYAYEAAAGVRFDSDLMATTDLDFLWDSRSRLVFMDPVGDFAAGGLLSLLKNVDPTFEQMINMPYRAVNKAGFFVDVVKATPSPPWKIGEKEKIAPNDLSPSWIDEIKGLISSEKFTATAIDERGMPVNMVCPDPRSFALYKSWLSQQVRREPIKRRRDLMQSHAVVDLVTKQLTHLKFDDNELRMFPGSTLVEAKAAFLKI